MIYLTIKVRRVSLALDMKDLLKIMLILSGVDLKNKKMLDIEKATNLVFLNQLIGKFSPL